MLVKQKRITKKVEKLQIVFRRMKEEDTPEVIALGKINLGFAVSKESIFWPEKMLMGWIKNSKDPLIIAESKGKIVGFIFVSIHQPTGKAILENILVHADYQNKGIGEQLLQQCLAVLNKQGIDYLCVLIRKNNVPVVKFALKHGFKQGYDFVWFEKWLGENLFKQ